MKQYLEENELMPLSHPAVRQWINEHGTGEDETAKAIALYLSVRDGIRYDPFDIRFEPQALKADRIIEKGRGHCVDKALLYVTLCRAAGIPSRIGLARVRNHMGTARLEGILQSDILTPHGYAEVFLEGKWVKCTPAFNRELCERLGVDPLEFNGKEDSIFQGYDRGEGFMEYLEDYGHFAELPTERLRSLMQQEYPHLFDEDGTFLVERFNNN